ncbi:Ste/ste7/mek1 protein kinase, variant, partial [Globisporangium splendens]
MGMNNSFTAGAGAYVKGKYAITPTGVVMKGTGRAFSVVPEELEWGGTVIGRGCSGSVTISRHRPTNTPLALKMINMYDKGKREQIIREINALFDSNCPCLVTFYGAFLRDNAVVPALEFMDGGSLENVIHQLGTIPEHVLGSIAYQILYSLSYLKTHKRVHRDIKPPNILLNSRGEVKLSDFGIATELCNSIGTTCHGGNLPICTMCGTFVGTFRYMSPERIQRAPYSYSSDIWSLGLVLMEAATGVYPYPKHKTCIEDMHIFVRMQMIQSEYFSREFCEFLQRCLQKQPLDRASADVLFESPWLQRCGAISTLLASALVD